MRRTPLLVLGAVVGGLLAAGCSSGTAETTGSSDTTALGTTTVTTAAATTTTVDAVVADAGCVACHTDQATLQAMAVEPVAEEILSEGEG